MPPPHMFQDDFQINALPSSSFSFSHVSVLFLVAFSPFFWFFSCLFFICKFAAEDEPAMASEPAARAALNDLVVHRDGISGVEIKNGIIDDWLHHPITIGGRQVVQTEVVA